jgi:alcohol dehydrogenase
MFNFARSHARSHARFRALTRAFSHALFTAYCRLYQGVFRLVSPLLRWREPRLVEGADSVLQLPELMHEAGITSALIVTDRDIVRLGLMDPFLEKLTREGISHHVYDETVANPTVANVEEALHLYLEKDCRALVAFGGGSPIDCAKSVGIRLARPDKPLATMRGVLKVRRRLPPLVAIPTTAGTGSEVTLAAVLSNPDTLEKYAISDIPLIPRYAALDPVLTVSLPPHVTATTGMDALTHAVEAFIGRSNTSRTAADAVEATRLIVANLPHVFRDGEDLHGRSQLLKAAYLAGRSFTRAYVGNVHAIAHTLGGFYGVPHGLANAVILPHVLEYYGDAARERLAQLAREAGVVVRSLNDEATARAFVRHIRSMNEALGIPRFITGIRKEDVPAMVDRAFREANPLYPVPRVFTRQQFTELYEIISNGYRG